MLVQAHPENTTRNGLCRANQHFSEKDETQEAESAKLFFQWSHTELSVHVEPYIKEHL